MSGDTSKAKLEEDTHVHLNKYALISPKDVIPKVSEGSPTASTLLYRGSLTNLRDDDVFSDVTTKGLGYLLRSQ